MELTMLIIDHAGLELVAIPLPVPTDRLAGHAPPRAEKVLTLLSSPFKMDLQCVALGIMMLGRKHIFIFTLKDI